MYVNLTRALHMPMLSIGCTWLRCTHPVHTRACPVLVLGISVSVSSLLFFFVEEAYHRPST